MIKDIDFVERTIIGLKLRIVYIESRRVLKMYKMITVEIDGDGYATVYRHVDGKFVKHGGYPYKYWYMMISDIKAIIKSVGD